jgi:hypothetical protein
MGKIIDLTGKRFERLYVIKLAKTDKRAYWHCLCDCGSEKIISSHSLVRGLTKSCGCLKEERSRQLNRKHGLTTKNNRLYHIWFGIKERCYNKKHPHYHRYGGRGIILCSEWHDYPVFYNWALSHGYDDNLTIDRKNNDEGYSPDNCRWADKKGQNRNLSNNVFITVNGITKLLVEWSEETGINASTIRGRIRHGWSAKKALGLEIE